jgi:hypothetical protein
MAHEHDHHRGTPAHHHDCGGLFGCGDEKGTGVVREDIKDGAFDRRTADRLLHMDEVEPERLDGFLTARGRARRQLLQASSFMGALAAVGPWFGRLAQAAETGDMAAATTDGGPIRVVDSNKNTVRLGVFDANLPPILMVDSGDWVSVPNTWSHFLNELEPGVPISRLAELRTSNPGRGADPNRAAQAKEVSVAGRQDRDPLDYRGSRTRISMRQWRWRRAMPSSFSRPAPN